MLTVGNMYPCSYYCHVNSWQHLSLLI